MFLRNASTRPVTGARPGATDIAVISFGRRNVRRIRVAVNFAARKKQKAFRRLRDGVFQQVSQTDDIGVHRFNRMLPIKNRRGDRRGMNDKIRRKRRLFLGPDDVAFLPAIWKSGRFLNGASQSGVPRMKLSSAIILQGFFNLPPSFNAAKQCMNCEPRNPAAPVSKIRLPEKRRHVAPRF